MKSKIESLRMERQFLHRKACKAEYLDLYRDLSPGQNVYWNGFGDPPSITFRADFDDMALNRERQSRRQLVKGRFQGGNLGWIEARDFSLFAGLSCKPLEKPGRLHTELLELLRNTGPMTIQMMKELTGLLVKEITPALHRLQEAFLIYEDQYDGQWDRAWYLFEEIFPAVNLTEYSRHEALKEILCRFSYRHVWFDVPMAKAFYKLPARDIQEAVAALEREGYLTAREGGWMLKSDLSLLRAYCHTQYRSVYVMHRNDFLVKSNEHWLKAAWKHPVYDSLFYILIDGRFQGVVWGHFKNGPYVLEDLFVDLPEPELAERKAEILSAVYVVNNRERSPLARFMGQELTGL